MRRQILTLLLVIMPLAGCNDSIHLPEAAPQLVVEGWIEHGGFPIVMVTTTIPVTDTLSDVSELQEHVVNWAKVTVSDGEKEVVLTGQKNDNYFPPYIYTTARLRGEAGKSYKVKVEYSGRTVTAVTTIPQPKPLEYIKVVRSQDNRDMFYLIGGLKDDPETKDYYKVFTKSKVKDKTFVSSFMGLMDDSIIHEEVTEIPINNGVGKVDEMLYAYYTAGDYIDIRFCTLDKEAWRYWSDFEDIQSLTRNPFFPVSTRIHSNVKGGLGYWAGYGSTYYKVSILDSLARGKIH